MFVQRTKETKEVRVVEEAEPEKFSTRTESFGSSSNMLQPRRMERRRWYGQVWSRLTYLTNIYIWWTSRVLWFIRIFNYGEIDYIDSFSVSFCRFFEPYFLSEREFQGYAVKLKWSAGFKGSRKQKSYSNLSCIPKKARVFVKSLQGCPASCTYFPIHC